MSSQLYGLAALPMLHTEFVAKWNPETVFMIGKKIFPCRQMNHGY
jgi:hypothetical protein